MNADIQIQPIGPPHRDLLITMYDRFDPLGAALGLPSLSAEARHEWIGSALGQIVNVAAFSPAGEVVAMVLNSLATPPADSISSATIWPKSFKSTWPGTNCVKELAMAMIGLPKSPSFIPVARHKARTPAMLRPCVEVFERYSGMEILQFYSGVN